MALLVPPRVALVCVFLAPGLLATFGLALAVVGTILAILTWWTALTAVGTNLGLLATAFAVPCASLAILARRAVLVEACATSLVLTGTAVIPGYCQRAAGADREQPKHEHRSEPRLDQWAAPSRARSSRGPDRAELDAIERERVERRSLVAQRVGNLPEVVGESLRIAFQAHVHLYARDAQFLTAPFASGRARIYRGSFERE